MKKIVLCLNVPELATGGWRDHLVCQKYPGAGFLPFLRSNPNVISANETFSCAAKDMMLIQEEENELGLSLLKKGAKGSILFCLESPLFAPLFYDHLPELRKQFQFQILFQGGTDPVYFPSFDKHAVPRPDPWTDRRPRFCLVMSNKHWKPYEQVSGWKESKSWQKAVQFQLHDRRYQTIDQLAKLRILDLYGKGWPAAMNAPELPPGGKVKELRRYQFGLCIENTAMPGYVTEKIIDCIVAGVVPVYLGAPDIDQFVPSNCFLRLEQFKWPNLKQAMEIIQAGQDFLKSPAGLRFSYQSFAQRLLSLIAQASESVPTPRSGPETVSRSAP